MESLRLEANEEFRAGNYLRAVELYKKALTANANDDNKTASVADDQIKCWNNIATCYRKLGGSEYLSLCADAAVHVLEISSLQPKAFALYGISQYERCRLQHSNLQDHSSLVLLLECHRVMYTALNLSPTLFEGQVRTELSHICRELQLHLEHVKADLNSPHKGEPDQPAIEVKDLSSQGRGLGVVALKDLPMHAVIALLESPFSVGYALSASSEENSAVIGSLCVCCAKVTTSTNKNDDHQTRKALNSKCPTCQSVSYCSEECAAQYAARHALHECPLFLKLRVMHEQLEARGECVDLLDDLIGLAAHVITLYSGLMFYCGGDENTSSSRSANDPNARYCRMVYHFVAHEAEVAKSLETIPVLIFELFNDVFSRVDRDGRKQKFFYLPAESTLEGPPSAATSSADVITTTAIPVDKDFVMRLIGIIRCNALEISDPGGLVVGEGLFPGDGVTYFNHSCRPNATIDTDAKLIRLLRPVMAGEEICISYIPQLYWPVAMRHEGLADRYFFTCRCQRCEESGHFGAARRSVLEAALESILVATHPEATKPNAVKFFHPIVQNLCAAARTKDPAEVDKLLLKEIQSLKREALEQLHPLNYLIQDLRNVECFVQSVLADQPEEVFRLCLEELNYWEMIIPGALSVKFDKLRNMARCQVGKNTLDSTLQTYTSIYSSVV